MSDDKLKKFINLDTVYIFSCILLFLIIESDKNKLDIIYLLLVTLYYVRIKIHRKNK